MFTNWNKKYFADHCFQFSWLSIQQGEFPKIKGRLITGQMIEVELLENYASNQLLYNKLFVTDDWRQYTSESLGVGQIKMKRLTQEAQLALKYCTAFFPARWSKNGAFDNLKRKLKR